VFDYLRHGDFVQVHASDTGIGLGGTEDHRAVIEFHLALFDSDAEPERVNILPPERQYLTTAQGTPGRKDNRCPKSLGHRRGQRVDLGHGEHRPFGCTVGGALFHPTWGAEQ
jgi:hypothetical protein